MIRASASWPDPPDFPDTLWSPISADRPGGEDLTFAPELDEIRGARKGDDPSLAQGEWVRELRTPQWPRVRQLCEGLLKARSKDLQVAAWYAEAMAMTGGFPGLAFALTTVDNLLGRFWDSCHPAPDGADQDGRALEERAGKLEWLDLNVTAAVRLIPLTSPASGGYSWLQWEEALAVDNLGQRNPRDREAAIRDGKLPMEAFQKAVAASGPAHFQDLLEQTRGALAALRSLRDTVEAKFPQDPPSLEALAGAVQACRDLAQQSLQRLAPPPGAPAGAPSRPAPAAPAPAVPHGPVRSRDEAILGLRGIAAFFRDTEPHSPVACLVERAAGWAEMPLGQWLAAVVKDPATLSQLRELLDLEP
jgi:type VI secretion system protein ImpA